MKETSQLEVELAIPSGTIEAFELFLEFCYDGLCLMPSVKHLALFAKLAEYFGIDDNLRLLPGSLSIDSFIEFAKQASLNEARVLGRQLLVSEVSPARKLLDENATLQKLEEAMDAKGDYSVVGALLNLLFCLDETESHSLLRVVARVAGPCFYTLPELLNLPLKHFSKLMTVIPHGEITENVLSEIILHYIDHRSGEKRSLSRDKVAKLLELIDETAVTKDYAEARLLPRLCEQRQATARLFCDASPFPYDVRCPFTMELYSSSEPPLLVCSAGHHAKVTWKRSTSPKIPQYCPVCVRPAISAIVDKAMTTRLESYQRKKVEMNSAGSSWADSLTVCDDLFEETTAKTSGKKRKAAAVSTDESFMAEICFGGHEDALFYIPVPDLDVKMGELAAKWCDAVNHGDKDSRSLGYGFECSVHGNPRPDLLISETDTLRRFIAAFPHRVCNNTIRVNLWRLAIGG